MCFFNMGRTKLGLLCMDLVSTKVANLCCLKTNNIDLCGLHMSWNAG